HSRHLLRLNLTQNAPGIDGAPIPLDGVPAAADVESVTWLSEGKFAIGTETQKAHRPSDDVFLVSVEKGRAKVTSRIPLPYKLWDLDAKANDGIEGLCNAAGHLIAGAEPVGRLPDGKRFAPIGRWDPATKSWTPFKLRLTSHIGKISGLACRTEKGDTKITVLAIERHFGVSRLLRFTLPESGPGDVIIPEVLVDFGRVIDAVPNLEGTTWSPQGDIFVLSDNNMGFVTGPTQVIFLPHSWP
ncbi:MAG TPA: esterase-like activity of phytase family protein, partial [Myxococcota bacterium]|nr:esterase-like activity of phytase family protein [Myxococcota bacterium]